MTTINNQDLENSPNKILLELKARTPPFLRIRGSKQGPWIAITPESARQENISLFAENPKKNYDFTILRFKNETHTLGKKTDINPHAQHKFNTSLMDMLVYIIEKTLKKTNLNGFLIELQKEADYYLDSLVVNHKSRSLQNSANQTGETKLSYINCLIGVRFSVKSTTSKKYSLENILGNIRIEYVFKKNFYCINEINFVGSDLFEKIMLFIFILDDNNKLSLYNYLCSNYFKVGLIESELTKEVKYLAYTSTSPAPIINTKKMIEVLQNEGPRNIAINMQRANHTHSRNSLSNSYSTRKLEFIQFFIKVLDRLFINYINIEENKKIILQIIQIFKEINLTHNTDSPEFIKNDEFAPILNKIMAFDFAPIRPQSNLPLHIRPPDSSQVNAAKRLAILAYSASLKDAYRTEFFTSQNKSLIVYRGDSRSPTELAESGGFTSRNPDNDIYQVTVFGNNGETYENLLENNFRVIKNYLCTSLNYRHAMGFASNGYLYEIDVIGLHVLNLPDAVLSTEFLNNFRDPTRVKRQAEQEREVLVRHGIPFGQGHYLRCHHITWEGNMVELDIAKYDASFNLVYKP